MLVESPEVGVHLATSPDGLRVVMFQGHQEYDTVSLMKEYRREVFRYIAGDCDAPPLPENYFNEQQTALVNEYRYLHEEAVAAGRESPEFPEALLRPGLDNTWHDTGEAVVGNWVGSVYQVTHRDRLVPFMGGVDPSDPLGLAE